MSVATTDAFRNFVVVQPSFPDNTVTTVVADQVRDTITVQAGFGITLTADPLTDTVIISNTGNGTGAYTEIIDSNANATYYPLFSRPFAPGDINTEDIPPSYQLDTIYVDNTSTPLTYNPSTGALTSVSFVGSLTGNADTVTNGVYTNGSYSDPSWLTLSATKVGLGNVENTALSTSTHYIGTTSIQYNRASASQTLNGVSIDGNAGTVTNGVVTTGSYSDPSWLTLSSSKVGLGNVTNESKSTMFDNPTFTGTVAGVTATHVGLGNVTNESKATMFTDPIFTGTTTLQQSTEVLNSKTTATGVVAHDFSTGAIWYHSSISSNFTANFTNIPTNDDRTIVCTLILAQGATPYVPNALQINGVAKTINWQGGSVAGTASKIDVVSFTLIMKSSTWTVLGSLTTYG